MDSIAGPVLPRIVSQFDIRRGVKDPRCAVHNVYRHCLLICAAHIVYCQMLLIVAILVLP